ncbi:phage gp6-like head-tail connector protein [Nocardioides sp. J54]|uniref:phage gp6-like head-tail connector protein n=1 Tax=Nocardioides sp. J54 TaxID=935866 RepID=UPI0004909089|nr:phage gp6-like head-tail connector protein [Nocardioides sp. J54]
MSVLTAEQAKSHLNITADVDAQLQVFIDAAEAAIVAKCGPLAPTEVTERATARDGMLTLATPPAISLTSLTPASGGTALAADILSLDRPSGVVYGVPDGTYVVVYQAGRAAVPADLLMGVKELVRHLWDTQRGPSRRPGATTSEITANTIPGAAYMMPFRVAELIAPHMQPGFA